MEFNCKRKDNSVNASLVLFNIQRHRVLWKTSLMRAGLKSRWIPVKVLSGRINLSKHGKMHMLVLLQSSISQVIKILIHLFVIIVIYLHGKFCVLLDG